MYFKCNFKYAFFSYGLSNLKCGKKKEKGFFYFSTFKTRNKH